MKSGVAKTLDELITSLSDQSAPLTEALLKTKVLLHKLGHAELTEWVNNELNGYPLEVDLLPSYRRLTGVIKGNISNGAWRYESQPLPVITSH